MNSQEKQSSDKAFSSYNVQKAFLIIFVTVTISLCVTLLAYYKANKQFLDEFQNLGDIHLLKAKLIPMAKFDQYKVEGELKLKERGHFRRHCKEPAEG